MAYIPEKLPQTLLDSIRKRSRLLLQRCDSNTYFKPDKVKITRKELNMAEEAARAILCLEKNSLSAKLSRDVLQIVYNIDSLYASVYPVFEMIDKMIQVEGCELRVGKAGYRLFSPSGEEMSSGSSLREFLINHIREYGEHGDLAYDRRDDEEFTLAE
jgi:hypothetical protein